MSKQNDATRQEAIRFLTTDPDGPQLKPGDTVYAVLRHRSSSGMMRVIDLFVIRKNQFDGQQKPWRIGWKAAQATGLTYDRDREGIKAGGCGMDMGFWLVYELSRSLFPEGFGELGYKLKDDGYRDTSTPGKRPASKRAIPGMLRAGWVFRGRNGDTTGWDRDGGYALEHAWI